jgi:hypothetical protein
MRFRLRTLLIVLAVGPVVLALAFWEAKLNVPGFPLALGLLLPFVYLRAKQANRRPLFWMVGFGVAAYAAGVFTGFVVVNTTLSIASTDFLKSEWPGPMVSVLTFLGGIAGALAVLFAAGRPVPPPPLP